MKLYQEIMFFECILLQWCPYETLSRNHVACCTISHMNTSLAPLYKSELRDHVAQETHDKTSFKSEFFFIQEH